ncbi:MAG: AsmA family protein [Gammaproteobacteria bacterium]|nr:AsmA family protein [Bacteroidales bacterium]MCK5647668.1 AsmA family protein [Gammaproteobacteria bacterium]
MKKLFKNLFKFTVLFSVLFLLCSIFVMTLVDINQYKSEISQYVKDETGLNLEINGDLYFSFFSGVKIKANDIKLSHNKKVIAHVDAIVLGTSLASLYKNKPEITYLEVSIKKLDLRRDKKGRYEFLPLSKQDPSKSEETNSAVLVEQFFLEHLSIKNIQLSIGQFQFLDKSNSITLKVESFKTTLSLLQIIDHYELVLDDPRVFGDYVYSGKILAKKALLNQYQITDFSLSFNGQKGNIIAEQLVFHLIQQNKGKEVKKLDFNGKGKLRISIDYRIPKGAVEPLWSQPQAIKITEIDFDLSKFLLSEKEFQLAMKKSHLVMEELIVFEKSQFSLNNLLIKSLVFNSDLIDVSLHSKDKYHLNKSDLQINNLPILNNKQLIDPLSYSFLTKFSHNSRINLSINSIVENKELGISNLKVEVLGKDKKISLSNLSFNAIDSKINAAGTLSLQKKIPFWTLEVHSDKLNLKPITELLNTPAEAEGYISINNKLSGILESSDFKINNGRVHAKASNIIINGMDFDKVLNDFESSQSVGLLDIGAVALLGPAGIALSKGNDYTTLIHSLGKGGKSKITELNSDISFSSDIASMDDVSFTTGKHQLVIKGKLNLLDETFIDFQVATVDKYGCPIYMEEVKGSLSSPTTQKVNILVSGVVNPVKSVYSKLTGPIKSRCKEPFYSGELKLN